MKGPFLSIYKVGIIFPLIALFLTSCDFLLPKKMSNDPTYEDVALLDAEKLPPSPPPYGNCEETGNDVSMLYAEHDMGVMVVNEFYSEKYFGKERYNYNRFLTDRLKGALNGIRDIERRTGYLILDYDPFIFAQDIVFGEDDFSVKRNGSSNWFTFSYDDTHVQLHLIEENGDYLIDDIKLPSDITITELYAKEK